MLEDTIETQKVVKILIAHGVINAHSDEETYLRIWSAAEAIVNLKIANEQHAENERNSKEVR